MLLFLESKPNASSTRYYSLWSICTSTESSIEIWSLKIYLLTQTAGEAIMNHRFLEYQPYKGEIPGRQNGSLISLELGTSIPFSLNNLQERGKFFIAPNENIYEGQVIGENSRAGDLCVNVTKTKKLTNMRASGTDESERLIPPKKLNMEGALEFCREDECVEVTPAVVRIRKVVLDQNERARATSRQKKANLNA